MHGSINMTPEMDQCIKECWECHTICLQTVTHCLGMGGKHAETAHIRLMLDCAEICVSAANFMIRGSDLQMQLCALCAVVCERCAKDCEEFRDDGQMKSCAEACRRCSEACQKLETEPMAP
jgi:hypothetical protein